MNAKMAVLFNSRSLFHFRVQNFISTCFLVHNRHFFLFVDVSHFFSNSPSILISRDLSLCSVVCFWIRYLPSFWKETNKNAYKQYLRSFSVKQWHLLIFRMTGWMNLRQQLYRRTEKKFLESSQSAINLWNIQIKLTRARNFLVAVETNYQQQVHRKVWHDTWASLNEKI